eukprot:4436233-Alexandrium_andersonii.AAC.1
MLQFLTAPGSSPRARPEAVSRLPPEAPAARRPARALHEPLHALLSPMRSPRRLSGTGKPEERRDPAVHPGVRRELEAPQLGVPLRQALQRSSGVVRLP